MLIATLPAWSFASVCTGIQKMHQSQGCCGSEDLQAICVAPSERIWSPNEGLLNAVMPSTTGRPHFIMGMDIDYPPYADLPPKPYDSPDVLNEVEGVGADIIKGMASVCGFDVTIIQVKWDECWGAGEIGAGLREGWYHACMTYTHPVGVRNRYLEFSNSWAVKNKPSGLLTRINDEGVPHILPEDDLSGRTIIDVTGWAPTADTLQFSKNQCTEKPYKNFTIIQSHTLLTSQTFASENNVGITLLAL